MSTDIYQIDAVIIGAGAVGLACAAELARRGNEVIVLEAADCIGSGTSSRNSEVIHAGLYYPTNSLKHTMCVRGRRMLYDYLAKRGVAHKKCGKLIVATNAAEEKQIAALHQRALENDVENVSLLTGAEAIALEPNLACVSALNSAETGIIDSHGYMLALQGEIEEHGGAVVLNAPIVRGRALPGGGFELHTGGETPATIRCRILINSAGLGAQHVAGLIEGVPVEAIPQRILAKGSYFACSSRPAFTRLIYPAPVDGGLGVHLTLDLAGRMRFGPDVEWLDQHDPAKVDYSVDIRRADGFYDVIRRYWPAMPADVLSPDYAGCRPKLSGRGEAAADFRIDGAARHTLPGLINLFGIESPGLTSSLALAEAAANAAAADLA